MINQNRIRIAVLLILWASVFLLAPFPVWAEESPEELLKQVEELEREMEKLKAKEANYDFLKEETKAYRELVEREWDRFLCVIQWVVPGLIVLIGGILAFLNYKSAKEIKEIAKEELKERVNKEVNKEVEGKTKMLVDEEFKKVSERIVSEAVHELEKKIDALRTIAEREVWHLNSRIVVLHQNPSKIIDIISSVNKDMKLTKDTPPFKQFDDLLVNEKVDVVVYECPKTIEKVDENLKDLIEKLEDQFIKNGKIIPIIVYYPDRLDDGNVNKMLLDKYIWYTFANNRITLFSHVHSLSHTFCPINGQE